MILSRQINTGRGSQPPMVVCKTKKLSWNMYTLHALFFCTFGAGSHVQPVLVTKISASELRRKPIKSALLVGYDSECNSKSLTVWEPPRMLSPALVFSCSFPPSLAPNFQNLERGEEGDEKTFPPPPRPCRHKRSRVQTRLIIHTYCTY